MSYPDYGSPDQPSGYPQRDPYYPPNGHPPQGGYPAPPQGYPPQGGYPPDQTWSGYAPPRGFPQQGGRTQEPTWGYPPQQGGYPPQGGGYPQQGGYPPQGGYPQDNGYRQGGYVDQAQPGQYGGYEEPRSQRTQGRRYEPPKKSRKGLWITLVLLLLVCGGGGGATYVFYGDKFKDPVTAGQSAKTTVFEPATLGGRPQNTAADLVKSATETRAAFKKDMPDATGTASAYYGTREKKNLVAVFAMTVPVLDEAKAQSEILDGLKKDLGVVTFAATEPGPLGGTAKCADGKAGTTLVAVCFWTDKSSFGMIMYFDKTVDEVKAEFVTNRAQIEKQG